MWVTCRGKFTGPEAIRLAVLKFASTLQPAYIDVELLAADFFFSGKQMTQLFSIVRRLAWKKG